MSTLEIAKKRIKTFLNKLPKDWQEISSFTLQQDKNKTTQNVYVAELKKPWEIPGLKQPLGNQKIWIYQPKEEGEATRITLEGIIKNKNQEILFSGQLNENFEILLEAEAYITLAILDPSDFSIGKDTGIVFWLENLAPKSMIKLKMVFQPSGERMFIYNHLIAEIQNEFCIDGTKLCLSNPSLSIVEVYDLSNLKSSPSVLVRIKANLEIGKPVDVEVEISMVGLATLRISGKDDQGLPGPADLLKAIGFEKEGTALDQAIQANKFLSAPYIDSVAIRFNLKTKKFLSGSIFGHLKISDHKVRFSATFPRTVLTVRLDPETPIKLAEMMKNTYPELKDLPSEFKVASAQALLMIEPLDFRFDLSLADLWKTNIGAMSVEFNQLDFGIRIAKDQPVTGNLATRLTLGGVDFGLLGARIAQDKKTGWHFESRIAQNNPIQLKTIVNELTESFNLPKADWFPETEMSGILLDLNTLNETFELKASANIKDKIGPFETVAVDLHLKIDKKNKDLPLSIKLDGKLALETSTIQFKTDFGNKNWFIDANWEKDKGEKGLALLDFIREIDRDKNLNLNNVPQAVEKGLTIQKMAFSYHNEAKALSLSATNELGITLRFNLVKSDKVGAILGLKYEHKLNESEIGKSLKAFEKDISFTEAWIVLSWIPEGFKAPEKGDFKKDWPIPIDEMGKGVLISAKMAIKDSAKGAFDLLNSAIPDSPGSFQITGQLQFAPFLTKLRLAYDKDIQFKTNGNHPLTIKKCGIDIEIGTSKASIGANGILEFYVDQLKVESRISFEISTQGIDLDVSTEFDKGLPLFGLRNVKLHKVGFKLGVGFTPPSVRLGAQVEMTFRAQQGVKDYFGLILGFTGPIPTPEYVGMDITKISLNELIENLEQNKAKKSYLPDRMAELKAFSFVWAAKDRTKLPDGSVVNAGVAFHGLLTLNNWNAWFEFQANPSVGISGRGQLEEIDVQGFSVKGKTPDIKRIHYKQGNEWLPVSNASRLLPNVKTENRLMLKGGGALVQFSTYKSPYLLVDFDIRILDLIRAKVGIGITDTGLKTDVEVNLVAYHLKHQLELKSDKTFYSKGEFSAGVGDKFTLAFVPFFVGIKGTQEIRRGNDNSFKFYFNYNYNFLGISIKGPVISIPYAPKNFEQVLDVIWKNFKENIMSNWFSIVVQGQYPAGGGPRITTLGGNTKQRSIRRIPSPQEMNATNIAWMDEAIKAGQSRSPMMLKSGEPSQRLTKLVATAKSQTTAELKEINELVHAIENGHEEMMAKGSAEYEAGIKKMRLEILHLKDKNHELENKVRLIWDDNYGALKDEKFKLFDAQSNLNAGLVYDRGLQLAEDKITLIEAKINAELDKITIPPGSNLSKITTSKKWAPVAVSHFSKLVEIEKEAQIEVEYIALQRYNLQRAMEFRTIRTEETIIIK